MTHLFTSGDPDPIKAPDDRRFMVLPREPGKFEVSGEVKAYFTSKVLARAYRRGDRAMKRWLRARAAGGWWNWHYNRGRMPATMMGGTRSWNRGQHRLVDQWLRSNSWRRAL